MGVKDGIIGTLTTRIIENPRNLEISPVGSGKFDQDFFNEMREHPKTAFIIPETRSIAATIELSKKGFTPQWVSLAATGPGDPLLGQPLKINNSEPQNSIQDIFVSQTVAEKFQLTLGEQLQGTVSRRRGGRLETAATELTVRGIIPLHVVSKDTIYCPLPLMEMTEDYRNGFAVAPLNWEGDQKPDGKKRYAGFRLYATDMDSVEILRQNLVAQGLEVYTKAEDIATVRNLDNSFTVVFLVLALVVGAGAFASASSSAMDQVAKMRRSLAMLRLLGLSSSHLMLFTIMQAALTGLLAALVADGLFLGIASVLNNYFGSSLGFGERICWLDQWKLLATIGISGIFMICASGAAGFSLSSIEPSEGMRDV